MIRLQLASDLVVQFLSNHADVRRETHAAAEEMAATLLDTVGVYYGQRQLFVVSPPKDAYSKTAHKQEHHGAQRPDCGLGGSRHTYDRLPAPSKAAKPADKAKAIEERCIVAPVYRAKVWVQRSEG
jgi:hypothetical protein